MGGIWIEGAGCGCVIEIVRMIWIEGGGCACVIEMVRVIWKWGCGSGNEMERGCGCGSNNEMMVYYHQ